MFSYRFMIQVNVLLSFHWILFVRKDLTESYEDYWLEFVKWDLDENQWKNSCKTAHWFMNSYVFIISELINYVLHCAQLAIRI